MAPREIGGLFASFFRNFGPKRKFLWRAWPRRRPYQRQRVHRPRSDGGFRRHFGFRGCGHLVHRLHPYPDDDRFRLRQGFLGCRNRHLVLPGRYDSAVPQHDSVRHGVNGQLNLFLLNFPSPQGARTGKAAEKRRNRCRFSLAAVFFCGFMRRKRGTRLAW